MDWHPRLATVAPVAFHVLDHFSENPWKVGSVMRWIGHRHVWVLEGCQLSFEDSFLECPKPCVFPKHTEYYWILRNITEYYWILLNITEYYWILVSWEQGSRSDCPSITNSITPAYPSPNRQTIIWGYLGISLPVPTANQWCQWKNHEKPFISSPMTDPWCWYIWCAMDPINIPQMLAYIPAPWILWDSFPVDFPVQTLHFQSLEPHLTPNAASLLSQKNFPEVNMSCFSHRIVKVDIWQCVKTLYPWWTSK